MFLFIINCIKFPLVHLLKTCVLFLLYFLRLHTYFNISTQLKCKQQFMFIFLYTINFIIFIYFQPPCRCLLVYLLVILVTAKAVVLYLMLNCFTGIATLITHLINIIKININNLHKTRNAITFSLRRHIYHRHISPVSVFKSFVYLFVCFHL